MNPEQPTPSTDETEPPMAEPRPRPHEPLVSGVRDGVEHGYRALETVLEGMRGSLERVSPRTARRTFGGDVDRPANRDGGRPVTGSHDHRRHGESSASSSSRTGGRRPLGELVGVMTDLLSFAGEVAVDLAGELTSVAGSGRSDEAPVGALVLKAPAVAPGGRTRVQFHLHNRLPHATGTVDFTTTGLAGATEVIRGRSIRFEPKSLDRIGPHQHAEVDIVVHVPEQTPPGTYRGTVHATVGDAWAVVEIEVIGPR